MSNISNHQWLINNGLLTDLHKDTLFMYGAMVHPDVVHVYCQIDVENKKVEYSLYVTKSLLNKYNKYLVLKDKTSIYHKWLLLRLLKKEQASLNFKSMLSRFVRDYCGEQWSTQCFIYPESDYTE